MITTNLKDLPKSLRSKVGELTPEEIANLEAVGINISDWPLNKVMENSDDAFIAAVALAEARGVTKRSWRSLDSGILLAFLITVYDKTFLPVDDEGNLKPLPEEFEGLDHGLTGGEKFDLHEKFGVMGLEKVEDINAAYDFLVTSRKIKVDLSKLPIYAKDLYIAHVTMGNFPLQKEFLMNLKVSSPGN